ncbi:uncharacterized protein LOC113854585 [Abrus precatorius]|uniref:Uncharacterized protein LOC113854585 n=1 Tax=Abrus precatorius TaxID=3816 RepID=A0A8B8KCL5_ABRPR|nr:uncharacterized protein LOC113854585 [Abrus precatorius]
MEPPPSYSSYSVFSISLHCHPQMHDPIFFFLFFASLSLLSLTFLSFSLYKRFSKKEHAHNHSSPDRENDPTHLTRSILFEVLPPDSAKWASLFEEPDSGSSGLEGPGGDQRGKKKKRKAKKKRTNSGTEEEKGAELESGKTGLDSGLRLESACLYPFTSSSSAMQRRIKQQYDELVKCNESKKLTLAQVFLSFQSFFFLCIFFLNFEFCLFGV